MKQQKLSNFTRACFIAFAIIGFAVLGLYLYGQYAHAEIIGIQLSKTCLIAIQKQQKNPCGVTYEDLRPLDNSNTKLSGDFKKINGIYQREKPVTQFHFNWYMHKKTDFILVDPHTPPNNKIRMITIVPEKYLQNFILVNKADNNTRTINHDRYDYKCTEATIRYTEFILNDTINYFKSNCKKTDLKDSSKIKTPQTPIKYSDFTEYRYQAWLKDALERCKTKC